MSEPKGTLDTSVNGPEDPPGVFDGDAWQQVDWRMHEERVRRLRRRIFKAVRDGDLAKARNLQKLMLRNWSDTLVSVRQVTQRNAGRATAGIDGRVALTARARAEVAVQVHATRSSWRPVAVKRVYIPKAHDKTRKRPLGIPVIMDRCHQARVRQALEPEWEARFEARSSGFRPGRGCHDAVESLFNTLAGRGTRVWILDADLAGAFNAIDHDRLLAALGMFPARGMIAGWLKAGVVEAGWGSRPPRRACRRRCDQSADPEHRRAWVGGGRRGALSRRCPRRRCRTRQPGGDQLRRRPARPAARPGSRPSRSRRGWPRGWRRGALRSTRPRPGSCTSPRGSTSWASTCGATATASF